MFCSECGNTISPTAKFCRNCGNKVAAKKHIPQKNKVSDENIVVLTSNEDLSSKSEYEKFGGWLWLPAIGMVLTVLSLLNAIFETNLPIMQGENWSAVTTPGTIAYHPLWAPWLYFELIANVALLALTVVIVYKFAHRKSETPKLFILYLVSDLTIVILDAYFASMIPAVANLNNSSTQYVIFRVAVSCAIWIPYFLKSERVKVYFSK